MGKTQARISRRQQVSQCGEALKAESAITAGSSKKSQGAAQRLLPFAQNDKDKTPQRPKAIGQGRLRRRLPERETVGCPRRIAALRQRKRTPRPCRGTSIDMGIGKGRSCGEGEDGEEGEPSSAATQALSNFDVPIRLREKASLLALQQSRSRHAVPGGSRHRLPQVSIETVEAARRKRQGR